LQHVAASAQEQKREIAYSYLLALEVGYFNVIEGKIFYGNFINEGYLSRFDPLQWWVTVSATFEVASQPHLKEGDGDVKRISV
jgi:hypothetical protein